MRQNRVVQFRDQALDPQRGPGGPAGGQVCMQVRESGINTNFW